MTTESDARVTSVVRYPLEIKLPDAVENELASASEAVKCEFRNSIRWKRLRCRGVTSVSEGIDEAIFVLEVGQAIEFDWTWEGALAFRPMNPDRFDGNADITADFATHLENGQADARWLGEIVEVDEANGRIFIWMSDPSTPPTTGSFFVRPFEFLAFLHAIYNDPAFAVLSQRLPQRLKATRGEVHPLVSRNLVGGLPELQKLWSHAWGVLWGPPGAGKTYNIGQQVASCLNGPQERMLVVSLATAPRRTIRAT
jgi:hypothetical protein